VKDRADPNERRERDQDDGRNAGDGGARHVEPCLWRLIRANLPPAGPEIDEAAKNRA
jgi:hypothetical protein